MWLYNADRSAVKPAPLCNYDNIVKYCFEVQSFICLYHNKLKPKLCLITMKKFSIRKNISKIVYILHVHGFVMKSHYNMLNYGLNEQKYDLPPVFSQEIKMKSLY